MLDALDEWLTGGVSAKGDHRMYCPICEEPGKSKSPSASLNLEARLWNHIGHEDDPDHRMDVDALVREVGYKAAPEGSRRAPKAQTARKPKALPDPLEGQDKPHEWHDRLIQREQAALDALTSQRGLTVTTVERFKVGFDGERYTVPVRDGLGRWRNVRKYKMGASAGDKVLSILGHGGQMFAFTETLRENSLPVIVTEGEMDALLTWQTCLDDRSNARVAVVTAGGAGMTSPANLAACTGRECFVAFDDDEKGRKGAQKMAVALRSVGATVHVLDVCELEVPRESKGGDLTDAFMRYGATADTLLAALDRARAGEEPADDVLLDIQRLFLDEPSGERSLIDFARSDDDILSQRPARYVVDGWLPVGFFSDFFGEPGSHKTFAILDVLRHIRAGIPWHGHTVERGATLLFEGEGTEQLQSRILAWDEHHGSPPLAPGATIAEPVDLTTPEGVATVVRTVRDFERLHGEPVVCVAFDPLVEYMNGDENTEGMAEVTRGARALALHLGIAVLIGAHTNASGERARGGDQLRMRSGAHIRVERLEGERIGLVQEKQKNGPRRALIFQPVPVGPSLVLTREQAVDAATYGALKGANGSPSCGSRSLSAARSESKVSGANALLLAAVEANPGLGQSALINECKGRSIGDDVLRGALKALVNDGAIRVEPDGKSHRHYLVEGTNP